MFYIWNYVIYVQLKISFASLNQTEFHNFIISTVAISAHTADYQINKSNSSVVIWLFETAA